MRRGAFDLEEDAVCFNSLLKRLMTELMADEALGDSKRSVVCTDDAQTARDAAKLAREEKKREAIERSRQRQSDPLYFEKISDQNKKPEISDDPEADNKLGSEDPAQDEEEEGEEKGGSFDPFRPSYTKGKNKIFVR